MRTFEQLKEEIQMRKALGLPRIILTAEEQARSFGDANWAANRDPFGREKMLVELLQKGVRLGKDDRRTAKRYLKNGGVL